MKIILVEDSPTIRETLTPALEEMVNAQVVACAATAREAKQALTQWKGQWQLIIVDLFLASGSGLDVLAEVQSREPWQHVFVLSNYATTEMRRRCIELGAHAVFDKSTEIDLFIERCLSIERKL